MIDQETIKRARQTNLIDYLLSCNEPLIRIGRRYKHKDHDSLVFTENAYYWNSRQEHGNSIDFLMSYYSMSFDEAVSALTNKSLLHEPPSRPSAPTVVTLNINNDCRRAIAYLNKTRRIDYTIIRSLIESKHLYQEADTNNILFPMYDDNNVCVGAELQGTLTDRRFKGIKADSKYGYGFNIRYPFSIENDNTYDYALFFESAVDLLSFIDLKTNHERKTLERCILTSMSGLKPNIVKHALKVFKARKEPIQTVMCVDNDEAAANFLKDLAKQNIEYIDRRPEPAFKDYNDQLIALKKK